MENKIEKSYFDKNGKEIKEFAVLKIFHFTGIRRKRYYMYKWVKLIEKNNKQYWVAYHLTDDSGRYFFLRSIANENRILSNVEIVQ